MRMARSFSTIPLTCVYHRNLRIFINTIPSALFSKENAHRKKKVFRGGPRACSLFWKNNVKLIHLEEMDNRIYIYCSFGSHSRQSELLYAQNMPWDCSSWGMERVGCLHSTHGSHWLLSPLQMSAPQHLLGKESSNSMTVSQNMQADHCKLGWYAGKCHWVWMIRTENQISRVMPIIIARLTLFY